MSDLRWLIDWFVEGMFQAFRFFVVLTAFSIVGGVAVAAWQWFDRYPTRRERRERRDLDEWLDELLDHDDKEGDQ